MVSVKFIQHYNTGQIYSNGVEMALCSVNNEQIGPFVFCKDFFQDALKAWFTKKADGAYGYSYNPKTDPPLDLKSTRILLTNANDENHYKKLPVILDFMNQIENKMGLTPTTGELVKNPPEKYAGCGVLLLKGDGQWLQASPSISMYTLMLRTSTCHKLGISFQETIDKIVAGKTSPAQKNDKIYLENAQPGIDLILSKGIKKIFGTDMEKNYSTKYQTHTLHHNGGIVAFSSGRFKGVFPNWMYPEKTSNPPSVCFS